MADQITPFPMALSHLQGHSFVTNLFICKRLYSGAETNKFSIDAAHRAVPRQQLSFLYAQTEGPLTTN